MGLSVGVVSIDYLHDPPRPIPDFLSDLSTDPDIGMYDDGEEDGYWCGTLDDDSILGVHLTELMARAEIWCSDRNVTDTTREELLGWVANLPWKDGFVRLHLVF